MPRRLSSRSPTNTRRTLWVATETHTITVRLTVQIFVPHQERKQMLPVPLAPPLFLGPPNEPTAGAQIPWQHCERQPLVLRLVLRTESDDLTILARSRQACCDWTIPVLLDCVALSSPVLKSIITIMQPQRLQPESDSASLVSRKTWPQVLAASRRSRGVTTMIGSINVQ